MPEEKIYEDLSTVVGRANTVFRVIAVLIFLALSYYWKVQILEHKKYWDLAESNRTRVRALAAPRGLIRDRNGVILADNRAAFKVSYVRENVTDKEGSYGAVGRLLEIDEEAIRGRVDKFKSLPAFEPVVVKDGLGPYDVAPIESRRLEFPELVVDAEPQRFYPHGPLAAHVLGYLQERTPEEASALREERTGVGQMGGRTGIEREYEDRLTGEDGYLIEIVDSLGRAHGERDRRNPVQGQDVVLTLDVRLQQRAEELLEGREGVIIALDPRSGGVLAMASFPTFDPNRFITRFTPAEWLQLVNDPLSPLENRAVRGLYAPGSIFKLLMALGGLDFGYIDERTTVFCSGSTVIYGSPFACWFRPGHGSMDLSDAIKNSCNIYFYQLGRRMGIDMIALAGERAGLGVRTGIDLSGEKDGLIPSSQWKVKTLKTPWFPGETISVSIGQGQLQMTPLQVAAFTALIAGRGATIRPHLLKADQDAGIGAKAPFKSAAYGPIIEGMWRSVNDMGTGRAAFVAGMDVCGKTGSTQVMSRERAEKLAKAGIEIKTHSWFTGFAPRDDPRIVVTVLVEYGGGGGATAAPLAGRIFSLFQELQGP
jgi:penicillin-binding protein 2